MHKIFRLLNQLPRGLYAAVIVVFLFGLFWGGRQPIAVGLFPPPYDLLAHLTAYSVLSLLIWLAMGGRWPWLVVATVGLVALLDELQQTVLPGRNPDFLDGTMDIIAAVLVVGMMHTWVSRKFD